MRHYLRYKIYLLGPTAFDQSGYWNTETTLIDYNNNMRVRTECCDRKSDLGVELPRTQVGLTGRVPSMQSKLPCLASMFCHCVTVGSADTPSHVSSSTVSNVYPANI